jgi:hypothetical protein
MVRTMSRLVSSIAIAVTAFALVLGTPRIVDASSQVPFNATITTVDTLYSVGCPSICFTETGSGTASQLGAITSSGGGVVTAQTFPDPTHLKLTLSERHTLTGANGDSITVVGTSSAIGDLTTGAVVVLPWHYTITSGTGQYAGATGSGTISGTQ